MTTKSKIPRPPIEMVETSPARPYEHLLRMLLIGDISVGKSSFLSRYADHIYPMEYFATIGVDFKIRTLRYNQTVVKIHIWDAPGSSYFRPIVSSCYRGKQGMLVCYDVTNRTSFENVTRWLSEIVRHNSNAIAIIVGMKIDQPRVISTEEGRFFAEAHGLSYVECSSLQDEGVNEVAEQLVHSILSDETFKMNVLLRRAEEVAANNELRQMERGRSKCVIS
jgi:Ras-related protein Rab-1A